MAMEKIETAGNGNELVKHIVGCALADTIAMISALMCNAGRGIGDRVYCYCNIATSNALIGAFYTEKDKAFMLSAAMDSEEYTELNLAIMAQLNYMKEKYTEFDPKAMPAELFLDFDPFDYDRDCHGLIGMEKFESYDATVRFSAWFKEHGGEPKPIPPRERTFINAVKFRFFGVQGEEVFNPTENCAEIDFDELSAHQAYFND